MKYRWICAFFDFERKSIFKFFTTIVVKKSKLIENMVYADWYCSVVSIICIYIHNGKSGYGKCLSLCMWEWGVY